MDRAAAENGVRFGRLTVIAEAERRTYRRYWLCRCDCGTIKEVRDSHLKDGLIVSCGCHRAERTRTHGQRKTPEYLAWANMRNRCLNARNPQFGDYGGRGIAVHPAWSDSFQAFLDDIGPRPSPEHSIDRIDNNGNYEPGNVEWRTMHDQSRNKRTNVLHTIDGVTLTLKDWAIRHGIAYTTLRKRLAAGKGIREALEVPPDKRYARTIRINA